MSAITSPTTLSATTLAGDSAIAPASDASATLAGTDPNDAAYRRKATAAAIQFEGFFISQMLQQMRSGTREMAGEDSVFKDPVNRDMQDMADRMVADKMAGQRAFGIADAILRQLLPPASASAAVAAVASSNSAAASSAPAAASTAETPPAAAI